MSIYQESICTTKEIADKLRKVSIEFFGKESLGNGAEIIIKQHANDELDKWFFATDMLDHIGWERRGNRVEYHSKLVEEFKPKHP